MNGLFLPLDLFHTRGTHILLLIASGISRCTYSLSRSQCMLSLSLSLSFSYKATYLYVLSHSRSQYAISLSQQATLVYVVSHSRSQQSISLSLTYIHNPSHSKYLCSLTLGYNICALCLSHIKRHKYQGILSLLHSQDHSCEQTYPCVVQINLTKATHSRSIKTTFFTQLTVDTQIHGFPSSISFN